MNQFLASHASHDVVQSAAVVDADGVDGAVAIDNYEKPVSGVISVVQNNQRTYRRRYRNGIKIGFPIFQVNPLYVIRILPLNIFCNN